MLSLLLLLFLDGTQLLLPIFVQRSNEKVKGKNGKPFCIFGKLFIDWKIDFHFPHIEMFITRSEAEKTYAHTHMKEYRPSFKVICQMTFAYTMRIRTIL